MAMNMVVYHILSLTPSKRRPRPLALMSAQRSRMPEYYLHPQVTFFIFMCKLFSHNQLSVLFFITAVLLDNEK